MMISTIATIWLAAHGCHTVEAVINNLKVPIVKHAIVLDPTQTAGVVRWWNMQPPPSDERHTSAIVVLYHSGRVELLLGDKGEVCRGNTIKPEDVPGLMDAIMGTAT